MGVELKGLALHPLHADEGEMHVVVPTAHTVSRQHVMTLLMAAGHSPLLAGPPISGKTLLLRHLLTICPLLRPEKVHSMWVTFHATSSPWTMQVGELCFLLVANTISFTRCMSAMI